MTPCLLGIDLGTSGTKTILFDPEGRALASASAEYPLYQPQNGWAEQDPEDWWHAARDTIRAVVTRSGVDPSCIRGIGISGQMHGLVLLDEGDLVGIAAGISTGIGACIRTGGSTAAGSQTQSHGTGKQHSEKSLLCHFLFPP